MDYSQLLGFSPDLIIVIVICYTLLELAKIIVEKWKAPKG